MKKVVIVGGSAAGCKTAAHLKRLSGDYDITIIEKESNISFGTCGMAFWVGEIVDDLKKLSATSWGEVRDSQYFKFAKDIEVLIDSQVEKIDTNNKQVFYRNCKTNEQAFLCYDYLVVSTGAAPNKSPFPVPQSERLFSFHNINDAKRLKSILVKGMLNSVAVIGAGFVGLEVCEILTDPWETETYLFEKESSMLSRTIDPEFSILVEKEAISKNVNMHLNTEIRAIEEYNETLKINYFDGETDKSIYVDAVIMCNGVKPNTELARTAGIEIGKLGGIVTDAELKTSIDGIWACGDCIEVKSAVTGENTLFQLGSLANRQGRLVAESIAGNKPNFKAVAGASLIKFFVLYINSTGITETFALKNKLYCSAVVGCFDFNAEFYPENSIMYAKLLYEKATFKLLGLQIIGTEDASRYIDCFSVYISNNSSVYDLLDFEHSYFPEKSSAMSPLNHLASMALANENGIRCISPNNFNENDYQIIDIREFSEYKKNNPFRNSQQLPLKECRHKISQFDKQSPLLFVCEKGQRAFDIVHYFKNNGFENAAYLGGGIGLYSEIQKV